MQNLQVFNMLSDKAYNQCTTLFTGTTASDNQELFYNWVATSVYKYFEHKDATHLNRAVMGCKQRGYAFVAVAKKLSCHNWSVPKQAFIGKMNSKKMTEMLNVNDDDVPHFESILLSWVEKVSNSVHNEGEDAEPVPMTPEQKERKMRNLFKSLGNEGMSLADLDKLYATIRSEFEVSHLKKVA